MITPYTIPFYAQWIIHMIITISTNLILMSEWGESAFYIFFTHLRVCLVVTLELSF